jgi:sulfite reductase alpha subunit-like flavoprotein
MSASVNGQRHDRTALILYGSETGNSQDVAEELGRLTERLHFVTRVTDLDSIDLVCPPLPYLPVICSYVCRMNY